MRFVNILTLFLSQIFLLDGIQFDSKKLDLGEFSISVPKAWNYKKGKGIDSFVGEIVGPAVKLRFDCSDMGYANDLITPEADFINDNRWKQVCYFCTEPGVTYTDSNNVEALIKSESTKNKLNNHNKIKAYPKEVVTRVYKPTVQLKKMYPNADFVADVVSNGKVKNIPIELPVDIKSHFFKVDSNEKFVIRTIWPKLTGKGITGVYIKSRTSYFNFQMHASNLSLANQKLALEAFKTINFKQ